ncbi:MAG: serine/threonine-protein kinase [Planctomycetota bacterium]
MTDSSFYLRAAEVVGEVLDHAPPDREAYARKLCTGNVALLREVCDLLQLHAEAPVDDPLDDGVIEAHRSRNDEQLDRHHDASHLDIPLEIGGYRVIREIGRGGMGVVYECEQPSPKRRVAIKLVDVLRYSETLERRFTAEAELQGRLQHPGIAQIYEAGAADVSGARRPYFAMELVSGRPLRMFADGENLSINERLGLVSRVADGVAHAHAHEVVHRDLKHENVLVTESGQPKVLDFGIARFTGDATMGSMTITNEGQILGTIGYMAPEQLDGTPGSVGPPADVYALGVLLYELTAGVPPHSLDGLSIGAAVRLLDTQSPPPLRTVRDGISRDIETVVGKCLERDPRRRYQTAGELAADLRRILDNRPIVARPPSRRYRATMFAKRNKALVGGCAATMLTLAIGATVATVLGVGQREAKLEAEAERELALQNELDAIRGIIAGGAALASRGDTWEATRQLHAINPASRGWEWKYQSLAMPWILEPPPKLPLNDGPLPLAFQSYVSEYEALFLAQGEQVVPLLYNLLTGKWTEIDAEQPVLIGSSISSVAPHRSAAAVTRDGTVSWLNVDAGEITPTALTLNKRAIHPERNAAIASIVFDDIPTAITRHDRSLFIDSPGLNTLRLGDDIPDDPHAGPWWEIAMPPLGAPYIVVANWGFDSKGAELVCIDRRTLEVVAAAPASYGIPEVAMDASGSMIYTRSDTGFDIFTVPDLKPIGSMNDIGSAVNLAADPNGGAAVVCDGNETLRFYSPDGESRDWPEPIGAQAFSRSPRFARGGRLLVGMAPGDNMPWIIDTDNPIEPRLRAVTPLEGHDTWVYQIAISPDGSLLASAAPMGDLILWDLTSGRMLHRVDRVAGRTPSAQAHAQDAPLVFSDDGKTLFLGGFDEAANQPGLFSLDLRSGTQNWTQAEDRSELHRLLSRKLGDTPRSLYHHAATLPGNRVIEATSSQYFLNRVAVLDSHSESDAVLHTSSANIAGGVAVSPDGRQFVACGPYEVFIRDSETLEIVHKLADLLGQSMYGFAYSPDGSRLAIGTREGRVLIYETRYYKRLSVIEVPRFDSDRWAAGDPENRKYVYSLAWTPDGTRLVCSGGSVIRVLESERPFARDHKASAWRADLEAARSGRPSSSAAERMVAIERWGNRVERDRSRDAANH